MDIQGGDMKQLWPDELVGFLAQRSAKRVTIVDVRTHEAFVEAHIPGSVSIPALSIKERALELDPMHETVFVCERGAKSLAVALIYEANFSPEGAVYNLMGGLDAFMGRLAYGLPKIHLIPQSGNLNEMLMAALNLEKGAWQFYQRLEPFMGGVGPVAVVRHLATLEHSHMNVIYTYLKRMTPQVSDRMVLINTLSGTLTEGGETLSNLFGCLEKGRVHWKTLFEMALDMEMTAYEIYRGIAMSMKGEDALFFYAMAEAERGHMRMLLTEIDAEVGSIL